MKGVKRQFLCNNLKRRLLLTIIGAHKAIIHESQARWTSARDSRTAIRYSRCGQTQVRTVSIETLTMIDTVWLSVWVIHMNGHRVLQLLRNGISLDYFCLFQQREINSYHMQCRYWFYIFSREFIRFEYSFLIPVRPVDMIFECCNREWMSQVVSRIQDNLSSSAIVVA